MDHTKPSSPTERFGVIFPSVKNADIRKKLEKTGIKIHENLETLKGLPNNQHEEVEAEAAIAATPNEQDTLAKSATVHSQLPPNTASSSIKNSPTDISDEDMKQLNAFPEIDSEETADKELLEYFMTKDYSELYRLLFALQTDATATGFRSSDKTKKAIGLVATMDAIIKNKVQNQEDRFNDKNTKNHIKEISKTAQNASTKIQKKRNPKHGENDNIIISACRKIEKIERQIVNTAPILMAGNSGFFQKAM